MVSQCGFGLILKLFFMLFVKHSGQTSEKLSGMELWYLEKDPFGPFQNAKWRLSESKG